MENNSIKIVQNLLVQQNKYNLSVKLEGAYAKYEYIQEWNGVTSYSLELYVHPSYFIELQKLSKDEIELLKLLFNGLSDSSSFVDNVQFKIDSNVKVSSIKDSIYIFVDEAGDMDFSSKGSKYYMFNFLIKRRPFNLHEYISNYRYTLLERNLDPLNDKRLDIEAFHACEDNKYIKDEMFNIIATFNEDSVKCYSYILEKPKVNPTKRQEKDKFYVDNLNLAIQRLLDKLSINCDFIVITDRLPVHKNKNKQIGALKKGIKEYLKNNSLNFRYDIFHHCSASSANLQIVDYISWAIFRKYERNQDLYFNKIEQYILKIDLMTKDRNVNHYEK